LKPKEDSQELFLSNYGNIELMKSILGKGASYRFQANGFSMRPFIRNGDIITISPLTKEPAISLGRVVAFIHPLTRKLVVHRIINKPRAFYMIKADNVLKPDGLVSRDDLLGYVSKVERNGKAVILGLGLERYFIAWLSRSFQVFPLLLLLWRYPRRFLIKG